MTIEPVAIPGKNIYQRVNAVRRAIGYVQKDKSVSTGKGGSYKAVTHDMVTAMVRNPMIEHGIVCVPSIVSSETIQPPPKTDGTEKQLRYEATYDFSFINEDNPEDKIVIRIQAHANDSGDKAPGKAISYAKKYAILKLFEIETGEDEESRVKDSSIFPIEFYIEQINEAKDIQSLKEVFSSAYKSAVEAKDTEAQNMIILAKDKRKKVIDSETRVQE